jgi:cyclic pyranopterin phosphate synthase
MVKRTARRSPRPGTQALSHVDAGGKARMVDVSAKAETARRAVARAVVEMAPATMAKLAAGAAPKGAVFAAARLAGIQAAKKTSELIPLCHPLAISAVSVDLESTSARRLEIRAEVATTGRTGVEMEALTAAAVAALTVYDMLKAIEKGIRIGPIELVSKDGGKSGPWRRSKERRNAATAR